MRKLMRSLLPILGLVTVLVGGDAQQGWAWGNNGGPPPPGFGYHAPYGPPHGGWGYGRPSWGPPPAWGPRVGVYVGPAPFWPPVYYPPRTVYVTPPTTVYVQPQQSASSGYWYYCPDPAGYYPYVPSCPKGWMTVVPQTPGR